jgi:hypothetical protein
MRSSAAWDWGSTRAIWEETGEAAEIQDTEGRKTVIVEKSKAYPDWMTIGDVSENRGMGRRNGTDFGSSSLVWSPGYRPVQ